MNKRASSLIAAGLMAIVLTCATPLFAGPPLICHAIEIGQAPTIIHILDEVAAIVSLAERGAIGHACRCNAVAIFCSMVKAGEHGGLLAEILDRLAGVLIKLAERDWQNRLRDLKEALDETDANANPDEYRALQLEYRRLLNQRPDTKTKNAS